MLLFNSSLDNECDIFLKIKNNLKGKYYLIGENIYKEKIIKNNDSKIFFSYDEYNGVLNNNTELFDLILNLRESLGNLILYLNPEVILNNQNFNDKNKFRDFQIYNNYFNRSNIYNNNIYYMIVSNGSYLAFTENNIIRFFINNQGINFIILNVEIIYNYLLVSYDINSDNDTFLIV